MMARPFHLRDLPLLHRLGEQGTSLHTEPALTKNLHPVRGALLSLFGGDYPTYVWKAEKGIEGFVQLYLETGSHHAHIHFLGSSLQVDVAELENGRVASNGNGQTAPPDQERIWLPLLDHAVVESGRHGIHSLVAEVDETSDKLSLLRRAGFAVYTRQDIWVIEQANLEVQEATNILSPRLNSDDWEIQLLYANTVPRLVQLVESIPAISTGTGWVLREDNEITALAHVQTGSQATWMRLFIHPNAEIRIDDIIRSALQMKPPTPEHPVYCCVRRYQSWVQTALHRMGFRHWGSQAVMVKHTVHHLPKPAAEVPALETQGVTSTAPMIQRYQATKRDRTAV